MSFKDYTIDKVGWHIEMKGMEGTEERTYLIFKTIINFLQDNNLTTKTIFKPEDEINNETCFGTADLTEKGKKFTKTGYQKWLRALDRDNTKLVDDTRILEKELKKLNEFN